jgi:hypothetical protein
MLRTLAWGACLGGALGTLALLVVTVATGVVIGTPALAGPDGAFIASPGAIDDYTRDLAVGCVVALVVALGAAWALRPRWTARPQLAVAALGVVVGFAAFPWVVLRVVAAVVGTPLS